MAVQKKFALGRGLDALISNEEVKLPDHHPSTK